MSKHSLEPDSDQGSDESNTSPKRARREAHQSSLPPSSPPQPQPNPQRLARTSGADGKTNRIRSGTKGAGEDGDESDGSDELSDVEHDQAELDRQRGQLERLERDSQAIGVS